MSTDPETHVLELDEREPERRWHGVARPLLGAGAAAGSLLAAVGVLFVEGSGLPDGREWIASVALAVPFVLYVAWWLGSPGLAREKRRAALADGEHSWHYQRADAAERVAAVAAAFDRLDDGGLLTGGATLDRLDLPAFARTLRRGVLDERARAALRATMPQRIRQGQRVDERAFRTSDRASGA